MIEGCRGSLRRGCTHRGGCRDRGGSSSSVCAPGWTAVDSWPLDLDGRCVWVLTLGLEALRRSSDGTPHTVAHSRPGGAAVCHAWDATAVACAPANATGVPSAPPSPGPRRSRGVSGCLASTRAPCVSQQDERPWPLCQLPPPTTGASRAPAASHSPSVFELLAPCVTSLAMLY